MVLATYPGMNIKTITEREFSFYLNQASNILNYQNGGKLKPETERDLKLRAKEELEKLKREGRW